MRGLVAVVASAALICGAPSSAAAATEHHHLMAEYEYLGSGTLSRNYVGSHVGLYELDRGYPVVQGDLLTFRNVDLQPHTVDACATRVECDYAIPSRLFSSGFMVTNTTWTLDTGSLEPGLYRYFCEHHPFLMRGSFEVLPR